MKTTSKPLVSCIMPTYNRRRFVPDAIRYFLRQDYEHKELIILDDGSDKVADLIPRLKEIRYFQLDNKITLGAKLNMACQYAKGDILVNWDDDDWYAPRRLSYQVEAILEPDTDLCGINRLLYYDLNKRKGYEYVYPENEKVWLLGSSLCYTRALWEKHPFKEIDVGMDGLFVWDTPARQIKVLPDPTFSVHMIHKTNVSPKKTHESWWHPYSVEKIKQIIGEDWSCYHPEGTPKKSKARPSSDQAAITDSPQSAYKTIKNVFACLVHEDEACIIDLVRNLYFNDPSSIILLYNGGQNQDLFQNTYLYEKYGVVIHPTPQPQKYGYLHGFALDCMNYALEHFTFDTLTIVDSDQLAIQPGYSTYLSQFFAQNNNIGLLSSDPSRITSNNTENRIALQAFDEYELWEPLLDTFPNGRDHFVHWTFWPSTVFSEPAVRDLVELFKTNTLLQSIMEKTEIWATEEVIFPTLVRLLGYDITANPCSYAYVEFRKKYKYWQVSEALKKAESYWIHPVPRHYGDPIRKYIREHFNHYTNASSTEKSDHSNGAFEIETLIERVRPLEGWLRDEEARLLVNTVLTACYNASAPGAVVELGSYHGKATILMGSLVQAFFPKVKVVSIDPHDGRLGAMDDGYVSVPASLDQLKANLKQFDLCRTVEVIQGRSYEVNWEGPISLLVVDGLHDYPNVARDYLHFEKWIQPGGYIAFHDYADYFPGVVAFVDELLALPEYTEIKKVETLIVLRKNQQKSNQPTN